MATDASGSDPRELDPRAVKRAFARAAKTYDSVAVLQREVGSRMLSRLDVVKLAPAVVLDAGCGTGEGSIELAARYPDARVVGFDLAHPMAAAARDRAMRNRSLYQRLIAPIVDGRNAAAHFVCADLNALPFAAQSFDLAWSNLALQWVNDLPRVFVELRRCLRVGGLLTFTTFGPDTLKELRSAFAADDPHPHVSRFVDMHDIGDMLVGAGYADPVMDMEYVTLTYATPLALLRELKSLGATNATRGRARGLTGRQRFDGALARLQALAVDGRIPATFEIVYGHAWKVQPRRTDDGLPVIQLQRGKRG